jgi:hypothetical protein
MVMGMQDGDGSRDRAQLVLVGSIAVAFIIIGLVVVFNTVLFTDNLAARGSVEEVEGASELQQQVDQEAPELVRHVENGTETNNVLHDNVDENVSTTYNRLLAETYADTSTVYVNVTYNASASTNGTRVVQDDGTSFNDTAGNTEWDPIQPSSPRNVSQFEMNVTTGELLDIGVVGDNFTVILRSETASEDPVHIQLSEDSGALVLNQTRGNGTTENLCTIAGDHVRLNITDGSSPDDATCSYDSTNVLSGPYSMELKNADEIEGNYSFLVNGTIDASADLRYEGRNGPGMPYVNHVLLDAGIELYYQSRTVTYESNQTVTVREAPQ